MRSGTYHHSHFVSENCAVRHYARMGLSEEDTREKINLGEVVIGAPKPRPGASIRVDPDGMYILSEDPRDVLLDDVTKFLEEVFEKVAEQQDYCSKTGPNLAMQILVEIEPLLDRIKGRR